MNKYFYLSLFLLIVVSIVAVNSAAAQDANVCLPPPDGLSGWWPGDGSTEDIILHLPNLAGNKPVRASASRPEAPAQKAVDCQVSAESVWIAGSHPPQWLEIDLQQPATVALVRLVTEQYPAGETVHEIWGAGPGEELRLLHEFRGRTDTNQVLLFRPETPLANIQLIRVLTTVSPSWVAWREIEIYGRYEDPAPGISTLEFDISEYAGQTIALELIAEGDDVDYAGMFVNAVHVEPAASSDPCAFIQNCEFEEMANDTAWQKSGRLRYINQAGEDSGSWWGNNHTGGFWHDASVSQTVALPPDASTLVVEVCTSCEWSTDGSPAPTEYNARLSVKIDGGYLADHANPFSDINDSPPSESSVSVQTATAAPALPEAPVEYPVDTQVTVELLYPNLTGAFIELAVEPMRPELWTRLQWQDTSGNWHDIEGWQGSFNPDQRILWYVGAEQLGDGPFRWLVEESQGGERLGMSQPFNLPSRGGEVLHVTVALAPEKMEGTVQVEK